MAMQIMNTYNVLRVLVSKGFWGKLVYLQEWDVVRFLCLICEACTGKSSAMQVIRGAHCQEETSLNLSHRFLRGTRLKIFASRADIKIPTHTESHYSQA